MGIISWALKVRLLLLVMTAILGLGTHCHLKVEEFDLRES